MTIADPRICKMVKKSATSHLEPYLRTLPVTLMVDQIAGIDYSLVGAPQVTSQGLDIPFKGEFFGRNQNSSVPFDAPPIGLPQKHDHMIYFAVSEYAFNTASRVYHQAGQMKFTIQNKHIQNLMKFINLKSAPNWRKQQLRPRCQTSKSMPLTTLVSCFSSGFLLDVLQIPLDFPIQLHTSSFRAIIPQLARMYPNMELELETSPESAPFLTFTPGNVTFMPVMDIQAFALLPKSAGRKPLFQIRASTNISITINVNSSTITGSLATGR
nr:lipopolysaccharide-binding protein-like isoform X2 [Odocoileus virginianus texanus]